MALVLRLMLVVAALAYAAMPVSGMAATGGMVSPMTMHGAETHQGHDSMPTASPFHAASPSEHVHKMDRNCPDQHQAMGCGHCAACVSLLADFSTLLGKPMVGDAPLPSSAPRLLSLAPLPLVPPPRF
ncbi:hypothetical protein GOZ97_20745 [Agrobacterium vitis]|uniref:DUF2946 domain-containing protein n=1 Tax=Agrobacterium vitis TaxID=373 RepID=A0ABD6HD16_AGRVI|nr:MULTISPECIES: hypothetical protein [Rhizobium/Agrobacterium group]MCF1433082.1 hypothetical protein [Allorhizobium ampelinum]MCF1446033.1 hypothetical protein [Allorhizobium ampelinum]MCF1490975.1 hypothetical protein [Allorhizobium ampelinum]MUO26436.1 hypothetical protein [Agrobacterium vitis]MUO44384.1 hypothetical protein [Agrobacterium vitis]